MRYLIAILLLFAMSWQFASAQIPSWSCSATDIDIDDDGLIDICYLEGFNAIRNNLSGSGSQAQGCPSGGCNGYELTRDLDFLDDSSYSSTSNKVLWTVADYEDSADNGWQPIGYLSSFFIIALKSIFEGNGHTLSNLMINRPNANYVGLFSYTSKNSEIRNIGLLNVDIKGHDNVGGLVGFNIDGSAVGNSVNGSVQGHWRVGGLVGYNIDGPIVGNSVSGSVTGDQQVGGLVGWHDGGSVAGNSMSGSVQGNLTVGGLVGWHDGVTTDNRVYAMVRGNENVGGLVGFNWDRIVNSHVNRIVNSHVSGSVTGSRQVGGLVGENRGGTIDNSYAIGNVEGANRVGGLVGANDNSTIDNSYAIGNVEGISEVGGLIGWNKDSRITGGYAEGNVAGEGGNGVGGLIGHNRSGAIIGGYAVGDVEVERGNDVGGLIGRHTAGNIVEGYAIGDVEGRHNVGGLVGKNESNTRTINSYATGNVAGSGNAIGGLVGHNGGNIDNSYAAGNVTREQNVTGDEQVGGLVGLNEANISNSYAAGNIIGNEQVGGLVGLHSGRIINSYSRGNVEALVGAVSGGGNSSNSYWRSASGSATDGQGGRGFNADQLRRPTRPSHGSHPYNQWGTNNWDFGSSEQYPALKYTEGSDTNNPACGSAAGLSDCDTLLYGQRIGLSALDVVDGAILLPSFNSEVLDYRAINSTQLQHIQLIATAVNSNVTITVRSIGGFSTTVASGATSAVIPLNMDGTTVITIEVAEERGELVPYTLDVNNNTINEGERIVLDGEAIYGSDNDSLSYRWTQVSGVSILSGVAVDQSLLDLTLSADLLDRTTVATAIVIRLEVVEANAVIDSKDIALTIAKIDNGFIRLSAVPTLQGAILTAPDIDLSADPDGAANIEGYQWQKRLNGRMHWIDVANGTDRTYRIPTDTAVNTDYRVQFSYSDGQGYVKQIASQALTYRLDIDADDNGLIDINDLEDLNAVRYQLDGTGYKASDVASKITTGCRLVNKQETCNGYELERNLDFNDDDSYGLGIANKADWTSGLGWQPIGTADKPFNSIFRANNHTISNLYINRAYAQNDVGLFGATGDKAEIADIGLLDADIIGNDGVAGLVGYKKGGTVSNSYVTGRVSGRGRYDAGGLVGWHRGGTITDSHTSSTVVGLGENSGGLVGDNDSGTITNSYALGSVVANENSGGLVGRNSGSVAQSYASVVVEGSGAVGGLVGYNDRGTITNSRATGDVTGRVDIGGLLGWNNAGIIINSYARGDVSGDAAVGGLVGNNLRGTITNSYARGDVSGVNQYIGGLIGWNGAGTITNSYAWGDVSGHEDVGGFVGVNNRPIGLVAKSYAAGRVVGTEDAGGLVGESRNGTITKSYWNKTNNPTTTSAGGTSKTMVELQTPTVAGSTATEIYYDWQSDDWDFALPTRYPILKHAVGPDEANPACGAGDDLPDCGTLLSEQLPPVGLLRLVLSEGAILSPQFSGEMYDYHVDVSADTQFLSVQFMASDAAARIRISTDGGFVADNASSGTRISLNADSATLITITVMAEYNITSEYRLYVNRIPEIVVMGLDTSVAIKAGREHAIDVTVSDTDREDVLTLSLRAVHENQGIVELTTTNVAVSVNGSAERAQQSLSIKGLQAGSTDLALTVRDKHAVSSTVLLTVTVSANAAPTINDLADMRLLAETEATVAVTLSDADDDDVDSLKASVRSSNEAVATGRIAETGGANRVLTVIAGIESGTAEITVVVDDDREVANSVVRETFLVIVEANEVLVLTVKSPLHQTITPGSTASLVVSVWDANFDANDSVALEAVSSTSSVVSVQPARIVGIRDDTDRTFMLTGVRAGMATIRITAMDSEGMRVSKIVSVHVNVPPTITSYDNTVMVKAGREQTIDVTVSDTDRDDLLTLSLRAVDEDQAEVELTTTNVAVFANGDVERARQSLGIKGLQAGSTDLALTVGDEYMASATVLLTVVVAANTAPTINDLADISLLPDTQRTVDVTLNDADNDDAVGNLKVSVLSSNETIATAHIDETKGIRRVLTVRAGSTVGTATITVSADDGRGVANSVVSETFEVSVEANEAPMLTIKSPAGETIRLPNSLTTRFEVSVSDANFDANDSVVLEAVSSTPSVVSVQPARIVGVNDDADRTFMLTSVQVGTTIISITATDSEGASTSKTVSVRVNTPPTIAIDDDEITVKAGRTQSIDVTVSDADRDEVLTLIFGATGEGQGVVLLTPMRVFVSPNGNVERDPQSLSIKGFQAGKTTLLLVVIDELDSIKTVLLTVTVVANTAPTISGLSGIRLLTSSETTLNVTLDDEDDDDASRLKASVRSSNEAIATAHIAETGDATRVLTVNAGSMVGTATITVFVDDGRGVANSVISETFEVSVEANETPTLEIKSPVDRTITLGSTASIVVSVTDANFDMNDSVALEVVSSTSTVSVEPAGIVEIGGDTDKTFVLTGVKAGTAMIRVTATDGSGASVSETVSVHVNAPPVLTIDDDEATVKAGREVPIDATVSDANREDVLTLLLSATDENQDIVELATTNVSVSANGSATREQQSFSVKGLRAGSTDLALTVSDEYGTSSTVMLTVMVTANTTPTISGLSDIRLLTSSETTLDVTLSDADDDDDEANLRASAKSSNAAIATAHIAETGGAVRVLTVTAGSMVGTAMITVMIDDGRGVANSVISETFKVSVEMNEAPIIGTLAPMSVAEGDTIDASEAVSDVNNDDLSYRWEITNEADGSAINVDDSSLFVVPTDLVKPPAEATTLTLMLTVSDGATDVSTKVSVLVRSVNNGAAIPTVLIRDGLELMPPTIDLSADPDGAGSSATYVWQRCSANCSADGDWSDIGEASDTADAYTITKADEQVGYSFRLKVRYKDGQGYENVIFYNSGIRIRAKVFLEGPLQ